MTALGNQPPHSPIIIAIPGLARPGAGRGSRDTRASRLAAPLIETACVANAASTRRTSKISILTCHCEKRNDPESTSQ